MSSTYFFFLYWFFNGYCAAIPGILSGVLFLIMLALKLFCKGHIKDFGHPIVLASCITVLACIFSLAFYLEEYENGHIVGDYIIFYGPNKVRDKFGNVVFQTDKDIDRVSFDGMVYFSDETRVYSLKTKEWIYPN